jgi:hypothetical protein
MTEQSAFDRYNSAHDAQIAAFEAVLSDPSRITEEAMEELLAAQSARKAAIAAFIESDEVIVSGRDKAELAALVRGS